MIFDVLDSGADSSAPLNTFDSLNSFESLIVLSCKFFESLIVLNCKFYESLIVLIYYFFAIF